MTKKTDMLTVRKAYEAPFSQVVLLQAENGLCTGSQEGFENEDDYMFAPLLDDLAPDVNSGLLI